MEFPPHNVATPDLKHGIEAYQQLEGYVVAYGDIAESHLSRSYPNRSVYRSVVPSWDNTARWGQSATEPAGDFAITMFCGMLVFNLFAESVNRAPTLIVSNPNLVKKVVFPLEVLVPRRCCRRGSRCWWELECG